MNDLFFTGDPHYGHSAIIRHANRPFINLEEMEETLIDNWNRKVTHSSDLIIVLGDFALKYPTTDGPRKIFNRLRGRKCLIKGNHDKKPVLDLPWEWIKDVHFLKHYNSTGIWLSHYSHRAWKNSFHGSWHFFAHSHGKLEPYGLSFDLGVDSNSFNVWSIEEASQKIKSLEENYEIET